ncbi:putative pectin lyase A [Auriculariales sp. MPI-PUGE-AT-0066]|nr:putative pectin lyase A [Auriculariales sp. MPI-PUGE-AT-0066]
MRGTRSPRIQDQRTRTFIGIFPGPRGMSWQQNRPANTDDRLCCPRVTAPDIALAVGVTGAAEGFAKGVTGGGSATPVYPSTNAELVSYLGDSSARVIILQKTFDFTGTEGTTTGTGCAPWGTGSACQTAINQNDWCTNYQPNATKVSVSYDNAGILGITVKSNKSLVGVGSTGVIKGKGLRMNSVSNIIIQNIAITNLNPKYVWGGDAITINGGDMIWVDHVTTSLIGRQHIVLGTSASNRVTLSNNYINGATSWSATCDGHHYWNIYLDGSGDLVTMKGNYIYYTSGRAPKVAGNTLLHAVNNYWYQGSGHAFEMDSGGMAVVEGNVFQNAGNMVDTTVSGQIFTSPSSSANTACASYLGHNCQLNAFGSSTSYSGTTTGFFSNFSGKNIASADTAATAQANVPNKAGAGKI